jgi:hypothetical protein
VGFDTLEPASIVDARKLLYLQNMTPVMKRDSWILTAILSVVLMLVGCAKSDGKVDPSPLANRFASAEPPAKAIVDKAVEAINKGDYKTASAELHKLLNTVKLTDREKKTVNNTIADLRIAMTATNAPAK